MFFRLRFFIFFILAKNLCCLLLSSDLFRMYSIGFNLFLFIIIQFCVGMMLSWLFFNCFVLMNWYFILYIIDFDLGFILRSLHIVFTSILFMFFYIHIFKCIWYGLLFDSHFYVWFVGIILFFFLLIMAFIGYVLPCTMMSFWGLTVFSNILATIPIIGFYFIIWIWGCDYINDFTLLKLHSLHIFLPLIFMLFIILHLLCLHYFMSSDCFLDRFVFCCERFYFLFYYVYRDIFVCLLLFIIFIYNIIIWWYFVFHEESWLCVDCLKTSDKILPEWFFLHFFGFLKSVPDKFTGLCFLLFFIFWFFWCVINLIYWFIYCRCSFLWCYYSFCLLFWILIIMIISLYVILCFPIWMELQFWVFVTFCFLILRID